MLGIIEINQKTNSKIGRGWMCVQKIGKINISMQNIEIFTKDLWAAYWL